MLQNNPAARQAIRSSGKSPAVGAAETFPGALDVDQMPGRQ